MTVTFAFRGLSLSFFLSFLRRSLAFQVSLSRPQALESDGAQILALLLPGCVTSKMYDTFCALLSNFENENIPSIYTSWGFCEDYVGLFV